MHLQSEFVPQIRELIEGRGIYTLFQPILSARQRTIVGLESLARGVVGVEALSRGTMQTIEQMIPPNILFGLAQEQGCGEALELLCRETAVRTFAALPGRRDDLMLFLNFDVAAISDKRFSVTCLHEIVRSVGLKPGNVAIEILEAQIEDLDELRWLLAQFREYGFPMVLDDVGSGHSNLDRVPIIQPDIIKIDRGLISHVDSDFHRQETVKSLVQLARRIGALVVAEGIETEAEAMTSLELGADLLQGFLLARPDREGSMQDAAGRVDGLSRRYRDYMVRKINDRKLQHRQFNVITNQILCELTHAQASEFGAILKGVIGKHPGVECIYVMDEQGIQITDTICRDGSLATKDAISLFRPAPKGADHSLKEYYYILLDVELQKYTTEPYVSLASGNLCRTISTCFREASNHKMHVLCIDVLCE